MPMLYGLTDISSASRFYNGFLRFDGIDVLKLWTEKWKRAVFGRDKLGYEDST